MSIQSHEDYLRFETLCKDSFQKPEEAIRIEEILQSYFLNPNFLVEYKQLLAYTHNSFVVAQVAKGLLRCITQYWNSIPQDQRKDIKSSSWIYIESLPQVEQFSMVAMYKLYSRILKFTWNEENSQSVFMEAIKAMLKKSPEHHCLALRILKDVICEFNEQNGDHLQTAQHRNLSISLRDNALMKFYSISLDSLKTISTNIETDKIYEKIREYALELSYSCLSFDFIKTTSIDASEEILTVQIPSNWKPLFDDATTTQTYFSIYKQYRSSKALDCLIQISSIRRSLFMNEDERSKFLSNIFKGTLEVLQTSIGLNNENNHLSFSRVLERIKSNYHLNQLITLEGYQEWIALLSKFTIDTLKSPQFSPNSIYYLLSLWAKFVSSLIYVKGDPNKTNLDKYTPTIFETFLNSKIESCFFEEEDDNLTDYEKMVELLEHVPFLGRLTYTITCNQIVQIFDRVSQQFSVEQNINNIMVLERQCAWLVYIVGCLITGRTVNSSEENDTLDGDMASRVFKLIDFADKKLQNDRDYRDRTSRVALELSFVYFMQNFRKVYIGEHTISSSKIYPRISELLGTNDHTSILFSIIKKIGFNFKYWGEVDDVIKRSLDMFWDTVNGHSTSKILLNTQITHDILRNHSSKIFPFLDNNSNSRHRTTLYKTISKLLFTDENIHFFDEFMQPFDETFIKLYSIQTIEGFRTEEIKRKIIGLMRDLRGIATSALTKRNFTLFFEWINPKFTEILLKIFNSLYDFPEVSTAVLKFLSEYVFNRQSRLNFDSSSPYGYIMFKETSKALCCYGSLIYGVKCTNSDLYKYKLKGISIIMSIFTKFLVGSYCNFGVFELFGDKSFKNLLDITFQLLLSVTLEELLSFPKVAKIYMVLIESLCNHHTQVLLELNSKSFEQIMNSILKGIDNQDITLSTQACTSLDKIITLCQLHRSKKKETPVLKSIIQNFSENPSLLYNIIDKIIYVIIYEDNLNQWNVSKPLLGCIIFSQEAFNTIKQKYIQLNPTSAQKIDSIFSALMTDIQDNLDTKNRDKFIQNVSTFRREMKMLGPSGPRPFE